MSREEDIRKLAEWMGIKLSNYTYDGRLQERVETDTCFYDKELKWNPFTRIEDAWALVEKVPEIIIGKRIDGSWCATIPDDEYKLDDTIAETAPEAICKAVLGLIESEVGRGD